MSESIFSLVKRTNPSLNHSTEALMGRLRGLFASKGNRLHSYRGYNSNINIFSLESADTSTRETLGRDVEEFSNDLRAEAGIEVDENGNTKVQDYSTTQQDAAVMGALAAADRSRFFNKLRKNEETDGSKAEIIGGGASNVIDAGETPSERLSEALENWSTESYDEQENRNTMMFTFTYNLKASRQNEFGEAIFPTCVLAPDVASVTISVDLLSVMEDVRRHTDGRLNFDFSRKSLVLAIVDHTILNNDTTKIYPVVRPTDPENLKNFVDPSDIAPYDITLENGEKIKTAPLRVGARFDIIGLSQPDYLIQQGNMDFTDQLDPSVRLESLQVKLSNGDILNFSNLEIMPEANFAYQVQGRNRSMSLNFEYRHASVDASTKTYSGSDLKPNDLTNNDLRAILELRLNGTANTDDGMVSTLSSEVLVNGIYDSAKQKLDMTTGLGKQAADVFKDAKIISYTLDGKRINTNRRERGQLLDLNRYRMLYSMPILAPISIVRPATEDDASYAARLDCLITTTYIRCSNAAVTTLLSAEKVLASLPPVLEPQLVFNSQALGPARFFVTPHYEHKSLDVMAELQTLKSSDRISDVHAVLLNNIRSMVFKAHLLSNYKAAREVILGDSGDSKPLVVIATDPYIAAYLQIMGDTRTLGDQFEFKIVSTPDYRMRNKIIMVFGKENPNASDVLNPLHFGNMFWRPELTSVLPISRRDTISKEITVQPSFRFNVNCPVMASITVSNMDEAVKQLAPTPVKVK